ncbi:putative esterase lipoprotein LPQC [Candidatus Rhodobacter oscarellae]|uniref:Putative esterase lipoprotein LPQC n=1 Tax=Candidatus Rhodobacter oscarellae TaxID=1675527 RepID=A0A0J9EAW2_9RHOB|nr:PHB depolymerase family esterase [Candidatus Rhodobacter lobularis]KMW59925.1 putative esterase lipoprotein LPQC [Candidatus Rhodobacter lobularis]
MTLRALLGLLMALLLPASGGHACSKETPCMVGERAYYYAAPEAPVGAVVYIHGWGSSGAGALRNSGMLNAFMDRGYAVVAPDGVPREGRNGRSWRFHPSADQGADVAFLQAVRDDVVQRMSVDPSKVLLVGFSIGGSMTAYTACLAPESFAAFAPLGGNFWRPHPTGCAGPVRMLHTHGWSDGTVPLEGRAVNRLPINDPEARAQGDIFHAMDIWRQTNGCVFGKADRFVTHGRFWRRIWDRCSEGSALELALHPGGHSVPRGWASMVLDWFEAL